MRKETLRRNEKFEDGLLRTDACMERHETPVIPNIERI